VIPLLVGVSWHGMQKLLLGCFSFTGCLATLVLWGVWQLLHSPAVQSNAMTCLGRGPGRWTSNPAFKLKCVVMWHVLQKPICSVLSGGGLW
jgi:hypothetical protein